MKPAKTIQNQSKTPKKSPNHPKLPENSHLKLPITRQNFTQSLAQLMDTVNHLSSAKKPIQNVSFLE